MIPAIPVRQELSKFESETQELIDQMIQLAAHVEHHKDWDDRGGFFDPGTDSDDDGFNVILVDKRHREDRLLSAVMTYPFLRRYVMHDLKFALQVLSLISKGWRDFIRMKASPLKDMITVMGEVFSPGKDVTRYVRMVDYTLIHHGKWALFAIRNCARSSISIASWLNYRHETIFYNGNKFIWSDVTYTLVDTNKDGFWKLYRTSGRKTPDDYSVLTSIYCNWFIELADIGNCVVVTEGRGEVVDNGNDTDIINYDGSVMFSFKGRWINNSVVECVSHYVGDNRMLTKSAADMILQPIWQICYQNAEIGSSFIAGVSDYLFKMADAGRYAQYLLKSMARGFGDLADRKARLEIKTIYRSGE